MERMDATVMARPEEDISIEHVPVYICGIVRK
jgi:hypothetical protein